ncbi:hypothetical protein OIDMADRAFT_21346 [Oidiodendron maius Zn]|uniref:Uncharacterized protein n=1 Tax=Oidiodendron maius (strain Zn) TaxID=913774 RepID=A0A0C3GEJ0_OIDMZ|nr:hypothetical protein OIDMADRAFT_21346 [Oidiodendron maius Zn]
MDGQNCTTVALPQPLRCKDRASEKEARMEVVLLSVRFGGAWDSRRRLRTVFTR